MESQEDTKISQKDVMAIMDVFTRVPPLFLKMVISKNSNVVKSFQAQIEDYKDQLSVEEIAKIKIVLEMSVPELQDILNKVYLETHQQQLKILAEPKAEPFIDKNLQELKKLMFEE